MATFYSLFKKISFIASVIILPLVVALILAESTIKNREQYRRANRADYGAVKNEGLPGRGGCLKENLSLYLTDGQGGRVRWTNNSAGFRNDEEFTSEPPPGTLRILSLGDSFTAGYRVGQHETFSYLLEQWVNQHFGKSQVMVSEIEDPATALYYLAKFGLTFQPRIVLLGITLGNDIGQAYLGLDPKGKYLLNMDHGQVTIEPQPAEIGESSLQNYMIPASHLERPGFPRKQVYDLRRWFKRLWLMRGFYQDREGIVSWYDAEDPPRLFDFGNALGMFMQPAPPLIEEAYRRLFKIISAMDTVCKQHQIIFAVEIFPQRFQVQPRDWESTIEKYRIKKTGFNLMGPNERIRKFCQENEISVIDPTQEMAKYYANTSQNMYLPSGDMHWNKIGHRAFFECAQPAFAILVQQGFHEKVAHDFKALSRNKSTSRTKNQPGSMTSDASGN